MKRYFALMLVGILALSGLAYLYSRTESRAVRSHQEILVLFSEIRESEASLATDVLKSRRLALSNYDSITKSSQTLLSSCASLKEIAPVELKPLVFEFCGDLENEVEHVERFKSKIAITKNSLHFVHSIAVTESRNLPLSPSPLQTLARVTTAYYLMSTEKSKSVLMSTLERAELFGRKDPELRTLIQHVKKILDEKPGLDALVNQIIDVRFDQKLDPIKAKYFELYNRAERNASIYRGLLFGFCLLLLAFAIINVTRLWKSAAALADANATLERRVEERTRELQNSERLVLQQQETLIGAAKMSALGEMAGGVAHEINNPLAIIMGMAGQASELLEQSPVDQAMLKKMIGKIEKTADRIAKIVQGMRSFSRDGAQDPSRNVLVSQVLEDTLALCSERFRSRGVELTLAEFPAHLSFDGRDTEISQVILNLLNNASDAIQSLDRRWIRVEVVDLSEEIELRVKDSGQGIPEDIRKSMFQPFFTTKPVGKGTGLGLSISLGIVKGHHGRLWVDAECPNTCFVVSLPKRKKDRSHTSSAA